MAFSSSLSLGSESGSRVGDQPERGVVVESSSPAVSPLPGFVFDPVCGEPVDIECFTTESSVPSRVTVRFPTVDVEGKVTEFASSLDMLKIHRLAVESFVTGNVQLVAPRSKDRASAPPLGFVTVYEDCLKNGLRLPLPSVYAELLAKFGISLAQVTPNSFKQLVSLGVAVGRIGVPLTLGMVLRSFQFKSSSGWFYLTPRLGFKAKTKSKFANWQRKFFFCRAEDVGAPEFPWRVGKLEDCDPEGDFGDLEAKW